MSTGPVVGGPLATPAGRWGLALVLLVGHAALTLGLSSGLARDELESVFFAQGWAWGYDFEQPPLYNWLQMAVVEAFGPTLAGSIGLRWGIIAAGVLALYDAVRRMAGGDAALAAAAVAGVGGTSLFGFEGARHFTHTTLLLTAMAVILWTAVRLVERPSAGRYLALGAALAVGALSKFTVAVFALALVIGALADPAARVVLFDRRVLWAGVVPLLALPGHLLWRLGQEGSLAARVASITDRGEAESWLSALGGLLVNVVADPIAAMAPPLGLIVLLVPWRTVWRPPGTAAAAPRRESEQEPLPSPPRKRGGSPAGTFFTVSSPPSRNGPARLLPHLWGRSGGGSGGHQRLGCGVTQAAAGGEDRGRNPFPPAANHREDAISRTHISPLQADTAPRWDRILLVFVVAGMALTTAIVLASGGERLRYHYMMPAALVMPAIPLLWMRARGLALATWRRRALGWGLAGLALLFLAGTAVNRAWIEPADCGRCLPYLPVEQAAEAVRGAGFVDGTIVAASLDWGANLRRAFPGARMIARHYPGWRPPVPPGGGACLILLSPHEAESLRAGTLDPAPIEATLAEMLDAPPPRDWIARATVLALPLTLAPDRTVSFGFVVLPGGLGTCR